MNIFKEGKFELLALMEMKLKGNREVSWCKVNGIIASVQIEKAREGVAIMLNDVWHSAVVDFGCVSSRILWIKFKFQGLKFLWWRGMAQMKMVKQGIGSGMTWTGRWIA